MYNMVDRRGKGLGTPVPVTTIDAYCEKNNIKPNGIKIDVEGYEMEVLKGANKTLQNVKYLMIELNNNSKKYGSSNIEIEKFLGSMGFKVLMQKWPDKIFYKV